MARERCRHSNRRWREHLQRALQERIGRKPALHDIHYVTEEVGGDRATYRTTAEITLADATNTFLGVAQKRHGEAINCAAWHALMELCRAGKLCTPADVLRAR